MPGFDADDIIGKTLIANESVQITRSATDASPSVYTVKPGASVGVVYSYVMPREGRSRLWWMYKDENGKVYFSEHKEGRYNVRSLKDAGVKTTQQKTQEAERKDETLKETIERNFTKLVLIAGGAYVLGKVISGGFNSMNRNGK